MLRLLIPLISNLNLRYKDDLFVSHSDWSVDQGGNSIGETVARLVLPCLTDRCVSVFVSDECVCDEYVCVFLLCV